MLFEMIAHANDSLCEAKSLAQAERADEKVCALLNRALSATMMAAALTAPSDRYDRHWADDPRHWARKER